jgi:chromosome segregation ATPase
MNKQQRELNIQNSQLEQLRQNVRQLSMELEGSRTAQREPSDSEQVSVLKTELREKDIQLREKDHNLREREMDWKIELHNTKEKFAQQEREWVAKVHELQTLTIGRAEVDAEKAKVEQHLQELQNLKATHAATLSQLSELGSERARADQLHRELQQVRSELSAKDTVMSDDNSEALEQLKVSHATELADLRRMTNFFKSNSERLSKQMKEMMAETRTLKESIQMKDREVQEQASLITAFRVQMGG